MKQLHDPYQTATLHYTWVTMHQRLMEVMHLHDGYVIGLFLDTGHVHVGSVFDIWDQLIAMDGDLTITDQFASREQQELITQMVSNHKQKGRA